MNVECDQRSTTHYSPVSFATMNDVEMLRTMCGVPRKDMMRTSQFVKECNGVKDGSDATSKYL